MVRRYGIPILGLLGFACVAYWWAGGSSARESPAKAKVASERRVTRFKAPEPDLFEEAARGDFGPEYQARVCRLCAVGYASGAACAACDLPEEEVELSRRLIVDVVDETGRPAERATVTVRHCGARRLERGVYEVGESTCTLEAARKDGALFARSKPVTVSVSEGDEAYVQLELRNARTGGLGVSIARAPHGIRVLSIMPGTPAEQVGLEVGDVIVEVDGVPTHDLGVQDFIRTMTGPEGSEVEFVVEFEDEEEGVTQEMLSITRTFLERS